MNRSEEERYAGYRSAVKEIFPNISEDAIRFIDESCGLLPIGGSTIELKRSEVAELIDQAIEFGKRRMFEPKSDLNRYIVVFYNRHANQIQTWKVEAENVFRAGRAFYRKYDYKNRRTCRGCIELICEVT